MPTVKSLDDLKKIREEALRKQQLKETSRKVGSNCWQWERSGLQRVHVKRSKRSSNKIESDNLSDIIVRQTGNIGLDSFEPIVQVLLPGQEKVTYGKVNPEMARRIIDEHVVGGKVVTDYQIES